MSTKSKHEVRSHRNYRVNESVRASYFGSAVRQARTREVHKQAKESAWDKFKRIFKRENKQAKESAWDKFKRIFKREKKGAK